MYKHGYTETNSTLVNKVPFREYKIKCIDDHKTTFLITFDYVLRTRGSDYIVYNQNHNHEHPNHLCENHLNDMCSIGYECKRLHLKKNYKHSPDYISSVKNKCCHRCGNYITNKDFVELLKKVKNEHDDKNDKYHSIKSINDFYYNFGNKKFTLNNRTLSIYDLSCTLGLVRKLLLYSNITGSDDIHKMDNIIKQDEKYICKKHQSNTCPLGFSCPYIHICSVKNKPLLENDNDFNIDACFDVDSIDDILVWKL